MDNLDFSILPDQFIFTGIRQYLLQDRCTVTEFNKLLSASAPTQFMKAIEGIISDSLLEKGVKKVSHIYCLPIRTLRLMVMMNYIGSLESIVAKNRYAIRTLYKTIPTVYNKDWKMTVIHLLSTQQVSIQTLSSLTGLSTKQLKMIVKEFRKGPLRDTILYSRSTYAIKEAYTQLEREKEPDLAKHLKSKDNLN